MKNTYWNNNGKHQQEIEKLNNLIPDFGYTDNQYINLFITISNNYYRGYNDGDSFLDFEDRNEKYIKPFSTEIKFEIYKNYKGKELEKLVDRVIEFIKDKDLRYTEHIIYVNYDTKELSNVEKEEFRKLVSGTAEYLNNWVNSFIDMGELLEVEYSNDSTSGDLFPYMK